MGVPSPVGTSIPALIDNSADSGAAPYSVSVGFFLAMTSVMVSVTVTRATTLVGIVHSTLTATILRWVATTHIPIRIQARRIEIS